MTLSHLWRDRTHARLSAALVVVCHRPGCATQYRADSPACPECGQRQDEPVLTPVTRPACSLAYLRARGLGEIVVRQGFRTLERRTFPLDRVPREVTGWRCYCGDPACQDCEQMRVMGGMCEGRR